MPGHFGRRRTVEWLSHNLEIRRDLDLAVVVESGGRALSELASFIAGMPKAELHLHIEGTLEPELKFELAARNGLALPYGSVEEMRAAYDFNSLASFLTIYYEGMNVLVTEQDFYDLAMAYFRKASSRTSSTRRSSSTHRDTPRAESRSRPSSRASAARKRMRRRRSGCRTQLIMCFLRDLSAESAMETLEQSLPYGDWIVGVGLDSDERGNPPVKFKEVFARARNEGFRLTMHCDVDQENAVGHIWQCLDEIKVERIDHGVNALEDPALIKEINRRGLGLTVCPISNGFVTDGLKAEEIKRLLDGGVRATINSDDPAYFNGYMTENFVAVQAASS